MKRMQQSGIMVVTLVALLGLLSNASATIIPVVNPGFEINGGGSFGSLTGGAEGWTSSANAGYLANPSFALSGSAVGYMDLNETLTQTLSNNWAAGTFTLRGFGEARTIFGGSTDIKAELLNGATVLGTQTDFLNPGNLTGPQAYISLTPVVVTLGSGDPNIGSPIMIRYTRVGGTQQGYIDDITLDFIPEPSSVLLFGLGGLLLWQRRQKQTVK